jgi:hypothetical protein
VAMSANAWRDPNVLDGQLHRLVREKVQGADDFVAQSHRQRMHGGEAFGFDFRPEGRPRRRPLTDIDVRDRASGAERVEARAFVVLDLEKFEQPGSFARRRCEPELAITVGEHHPRGVDAEQFNASTGQDMQELDDVEVVDQRVREVDEGSGQSREISHDLTSTLCPLGCLRGAPNHRARRVADG